jgi:hypothetical protein
MSNRTSRHESARAVDRVRELADAVGFWQRLTGLPVGQADLFLPCRPESPWQLLGWQEDNRELLARDPSEPGALSAEDAVSYRERELARVPLYEAARAAVAALDAHAEWARGELERLGYDSADLHDLVRRRDGTLCQAVGRLLARAEARLRTEGPQTPAQATATKKESAPRHRITRADANEAMIGAIDADPDRMKWSARQWARHVGCSTYTIAQTEMWKQGIKAREKAKQERMRPGRDRRRRPRHRHQD